MIIRNGKGSGDIFGIVSKLKAKINIARSARIKLIIYKKLAKLCR